MITIYSFLESTQDLQIDEIYDYPFLIAELLSRYNFNASERNSNFNATDRVIDFGLYSRNINFNAETRGNNSTGINRNINFNAQKL